MGVLFTLTIEVQRGRDWTRIAAFELGKAYELATEIDWQRIEQQSKRAAVSPSSALGYVYSRCPSCAGDLDGSPGSYVCRECKRACAVPGSYNGAGELAPDDATMRERFERAERERSETLEREPWRTGAPDDFYEDGPTFRGVRDLPSVLRALPSQNRSVVITALAATLEALAASSERLRCAWWGE